MSLLPRHSSSFLGVLASSVGLLIACAGAETQDVLSKQTSTQASSSGTSSGTSGPPTTSSGTSGNGTSGTSSGTSGVDGTCTPEEEPNDDKDSANTLAPVRCGSLSARDRKDFLTFRLKPATTQMSLNFTGNVRLRVDVEGRGSVDLTPEDAAVVPFAKDAEYMIEVTPLTDSNSDVQWRVAVIEK